MFAGFFFFFFAAKYRLIKGGKSGGTWGGTYTAGPEEFIFSVYFIINPESFRFKEQASQQEIRGLKEKLILGESV